MMNPPSNEKLKVVFVLPSFLLGGGIEMHLLKMFRRFDRGRFRLFLVTLFKYPDRPNMFDNLPANVEVQQLSFSGPFDIFSWHKLYRTLSNIKPHVVISSMFSANAIVRILKPFFDYKVITREHNTYTDKHWYHHAIERALSNSSDAIVAVSSSVADFFANQARISRAKITVINNGVDVDDILEFCGSAEEEIKRVRNELHLSEEQKIVLNIARLKPQKDHTLLLRSFKIFGETHPEYVLVLLGNGSEREALGDFIEELGLERTVFLLGHRKDPYAFFAASDFFILTSKREGFPNVGLEAMAFGLPFISTLVAGVDELLKSGENGILVPRDAQDVAKAMSTIAGLSSVERSSYRDACIETARRFDIKNIVKKYEDLIESLCRP